MNNEKQNIIPELRFPEFENDGDWSIRSIEENIDMISGIALKSKELSDDKSGTPILRGINITEGHIRHSREMDKFYLGDTSEICKYLVEENDIVIGMDGSKVGKNVSLVSKIDVGSILIQRVARIRAIDADIKYLYQNFISQRFRTYVDNVNTSSGIPHISAKQIRNYEIGFPPKFKEQQKIANCLFSLDEVITAESEKLDLLQDHKKGLLQQLFPKQGETQPQYRFPEFVNDVDWEEKEVGEIFEVTRGYVLSMSLVSEKRTEEKHYPVYSSQTKNNGLAGFYNEYLYENAITWTTDGANAGDVNYREGKFYCTNVCGVLLSDKGFANRCIAEIINSVAKKHVSYIGNPKLMNGVMSKIIISVPPLKEQEKIANCLTNIDDLLGAQALKIKALKKHKKGLMQQLFPNVNSI